LANPQATAMEIGFVGMVIGDTSHLGYRLSRRYELARGERFPILERMTNKSDLRIVASM
jgi:hypothetical protein